MCITHQIKFKQMHAVHVRAIRVCECVYFCCSVLWPRSSDTEWDERANKIWNGVWNKKATKQQILPNIIKMLDGPVCRRWPRYRATLCVRSPQLPFRLSSQRDGNLISVQASESYKQRSSSLQHRSQFSFFPTWSLAAVAACVCVYRNWNVMGWWHDQMKM